MRRLRRGRYDHQARRHPDQRTLPAVCTRQKLAGSLAAFIPPRFAAEIEIPEAVAAWVRQGRGAQGLYLAGQVGTGKTHAAWTALAAWCIETGTVPRGEARESHMGNQPGRTSSSPG